MDHIIKREILIGCEGIARAARERLEELGVNAGAMVFTVGVDVGDLQCAPLRVSFRLFGETKAALDT